ncbi:uncharacterized protein LACBIDRAFT_330938 [Laccaria bicolor S238N-H82]|uniref:Predicted protein n=1 Tax=Laccaria bicolor (strain S238N-H82 / ATCC MYA-4686) TaxID=486041 RepID=B0DMQ8_LACBS|nr:uncharacterized protein LACBIDRAFT_330938 [Laccaria bicolor S238N-H82]EDR04097.1 predicted protein [Laccaria bicolor S238N-H82]|eukprot:XP_001885352.1 predicted protein [Laccaria bicolor S238N-H82]
MFTSVCDVFTLGSRLVCAVHDLAGRIGQGFFWRCSQRLHIAPAATLPKDVALRVLNAKSPVPSLNNPIFNIDINFSDLHDSVNLPYHYTRGIALVALKRWPEAKETPRTTPSSMLTHKAPNCFMRYTLQMEVSKKSADIMGKTSPLPKHTHPLLICLLKSLYHAFINAYPQSTELLHRRPRHVLPCSVAVHSAVARAPRWVLKKLTTTYVTLNLADVGKAIKISLEDGSRQRDCIKRHQYPNLRRWDCNLPKPATAVHEGRNRRPGADSVAWAGDWGVFHCDGLFLSP